MELDQAAMGRYIAGKFETEGDFSFLKPEEMERMVGALVAIDLAYMETADVFGDGEYDEEAAFALLFDGLKNQFPEHKQYCMRMAEDYMDFAEEYLAKNDLIEWD